MKQEIPYKAAASAAVAIAAGHEPEKILIQNVAQHLRLGNSTQQKAFESFLRGFEQPRLMRLVAGMRNEAGEVPALAAPLGEVRFLFKPPLPGETQARLAYECFLGRIHLYEGAIVCYRAASPIDARKVWVKLLIVKALARRASQSSSCPGRD